MMSQAKVFTRIVVATVISLLYLVITATPGYAISQKTLNAINNNTAFYNPDDVCGSANAAVSLGTTQTTGNGSESVAQQIAGTFIVGFDAATPQSVILDVATKYHIGGMYLVGTHDAAAAGFNKAFYDKLTAAAGHPLVISSDEEGVVKRYTYGSTSFPSAGDMAKQSDEAVTSIGKGAGAVMVQNGLNTDLAPVLDLRDVGNGLTGRSFSTDPGVVADKAGAFAAGIQSSGIKPIFKHFPGFDATTSGSTDDVKVVMSGSVDKTVAPYKTVLAKYPNAGVMLSNMYVSKIDADYPSSLSTATVKYLRDTVGFKGMVTTDDLGVSSVITKSGSLGAAVSQSLQAGVDMPLFTIKAGSTTEAAGNLDQIIGTVQTNTAAMQAITANASIVSAFRGAGTGTPQTTSGSSCCSASGAGGGATLSGSENQQKIFNGLVSLGLAQIAAAGIMGNMQAESGFNPSAEQAQGAWEDMSTAYKRAVGLVQWDGGRRPAVIKYLQSKGLTDADFHQPTDRLITEELNYVWQELSGPYKSSTLDKIQVATTPGDAAYIFHKYYEVSNDTPDKIQGRINNANAIYQKYGNGTAGTVASAGGGGGSCNAPSNTSPDCASAAGVAKILCAAKAYDTASYKYAGGYGAAQWHQNCPVIGPTCYVDCSGLVNMSIYDAFGVDVKENTDGERADTVHFEKIPFEQVQPGDLIQPNSGHVEIIDHVSGQTVYSFGAHTDGIEQSKQVGPASYQNTSGTVYLHYKGAS